jgi:predicted alpha/beta-hydrolase family hydrolase
MPRPWFLFAPGAGAPSTSPWMKAWRERLQQLGDVSTFDYPYMRAGRKAPDRPAVLIAAHREALAEARHKAKGRLFLIGKSMGSRIGCHVSLEEPVDGLICFGYPLVSPGSGALRDEVLVALRTPILFVQGTHDTLCPIPHLNDVLPRMTAPHQVYLVEGGNHSLELPGIKRTPMLQRDSDTSALEAVRRFVDDLESGQLGL